MNGRILFLFSLLFFLFNAVQAQNAPGDTLKNVEILNARTFRVKKSAANEDLQILSGNVQLRQNTTLFNCDSCVINNTTKIFEAFGNVHIVDDTTNIYSNYLRYLMQTKKAFLSGKVHLNDGHSDLTTNELEYDLNDKIGVYKNGGKVVSKTSVLTSKEGVYYADLHDIYFRHNVVLNDPAYYLTADSLLYNSESQIARFISETNMRDSSGRTVHTTEGTYNLRTGSSQFTQRTTIIDGKTRIVGNQIASDDSTGLIQILGNGVLIDTSQGVSILANEIFADRKKAAYLATRKPLMIIKQEKDSIYVTADTLFSAKLSDRFRFQDSASVPDSLENDAVGTDSLEIQDSSGTQDSLENAVDSSDVLNTADSTENVTVTDTADVKSTTAADTTAMTADTVSTATPDSVKARNAIFAKKTFVTNDTLFKKPIVANDSTDRYFEGFRHVRIYSDSVQAVSDSLFYSFRDSTFQLYYNPLVWSHGSQMRGDTIYLYTKNKKADHIKLFENGFLINQSDPGVFNQVKATRIDGYFKAGVIDSVRANGSAESIYYLRNEDSTYTGINQSTSDIMDVYFQDGDLNKVVFRSSVKGTLWPASEAKHKNFQLKDFEWLETRRPKTKYELYE